MVDNIITNAKKKTTKNMQLVANFSIRIIYLKPHLESISYLCTCNLTLLVKS